MANENSKYSKAWELISSGDDAQAISLVVSDAMEGDLEALSILAIANINIGSWRDCDRYIQMAGDNGGRDFWFAGQPENYIYAALIARLDSFEDIATHKFTHLDSFMMTTSYLMRRDEDGAFYNAIRSMRSLFAGPEVREGRTDSSGRQRQPSVHHAPHRRIASGGIPPSRGLAVCWDCADGVQGGWSWALAQ